MTRARGLMWLVLALLGGCASNPEKQTLASLAHVKPDVGEVPIDDSLEKAMSSYRRFLLETPESAMTPEAMRRLADLQIEKEYGIVGRPRAARSPVPASSEVQTIDTNRAAERHVDSRVVADHSETEREFEARTTGGEQYAQTDTSAVDFPDGAGSLSTEGPTEALEMYQQILEEYPLYERNDQVLYQMARAYDELGQPDAAIEVSERLIRGYPHSKYLDEVQFRRGEFFFVRKKYLDAEEAYSAVVALGARSDFFELALYKLGWTLYKQELYEEALDQFVALLDYKLAIGYDFDQKHAEEDERRVADTFRVISLGFSNLGGPEILSEYFSRQGRRSYEDRIYSNLAEFYFTKLRYQDAATVYESFVELNPFHKVSPHFSMRTTEIYAEGNFPRLVVESKKAFATRYGIHADYWHHFDIAEADEVLEYLKTNLKDLANHYHALYQDESLEEEQLANYAEALQWYREYLASFPKDFDTPPINYQLADLLLEHEDFGQAALEFERTAYDYPAHAQADAAGYAAIFAHRQHIEAVTGAARLVVRRAAVDSSLRFAETFPAHEHAPTVLGAAAEDLYDMEDYALAVETGRTLIGRYPNAEIGLRRSTWAVVAHASFDLGVYADAEEAYGQVLALTPHADESRQALFDNLAAAIYKQGEQANAAEDYRGAAAHFLRIRSAAPTSEIRAAAEYDAAVALIKVEDWKAAGEVLEEFRRSHPAHELQEQVTKQLAFVYHEAGELNRSAKEYERVAEDADDPELKGNAMLLAGKLYEDSKDPARALSVYRRYVEAYPRPLDLAVETHFKIAEIHREAGDTAAHHRELRRIVEVDATAGADRSARSRFLGAKSALVLAEQVYQRFTELTLNQPFEQSLARKQKSMDETLQTFERLVDYEVAEVLAAATYYIAETYGHFSEALMRSERPVDLDPADREAYELALEEEAFPFEERAIDVHERNLELMVAGTFNAWIQQSLDRLAALMPGRYAKSEISSGFIGSTDTYAYRSPKTDALPADPGDEVSQEWERSPDRESPDVRDQEIAPTDAVSAGETDEATGVSDVSAVL